MNPHQPAFHTLPPASRQWARYVQLALADFDDVHPVIRRDTVRFHVGQGIHLCAVVSPDGGLRFKSNDPEVHTRLAHLDRTLNWLEWSGPPSAELPDLLRAARAAALYFNPAMLRGPDLAHTHHVFRWALDATPEALHPEPPHHRGGATPRPPAIAQVRIARWCAGLLPHADQAPVLEAVDRYLAHPRSQSGDRALFADLTAHASPGRNQPVEVSIARNAAGAARTLARGKPDLVGTSVRSATARTARTLAERQGDVTGFLRELDRRLVVAEATAEIDRRSRAPTPSVQDVIWRGRSERGQLHGVLVQTDTGFGLVAKLGRRWAYQHTELLDEALATVPEPQFPEAVEAALAWSTSG